MKLLLAVFVCVAPAVGAAQYRHATAPIPLRSAPADTASVVATVSLGGRFFVGTCSRGGRWCGASYGVHGGYVRADLVPAGEPAGGPEGTPAVAPEPRPVRVAQKRSGVRPRANASGAPRVRRPRPSTGAAAGYFTGPRGGCYTYSASGRKRYVDHSYCGR